MSSTAANTLLTSELMETAKTAVPAQTTAGGAGLQDLGTLFSEHYKGMFRVAYRITGSHGDAEDVLQTVFVRLTRGWTGQGLAPNARAFLYRSAINASLDVVRLRKRVVSVPLEVIDLDLQPKHSAPSPEQNLADAELHELVRQAVAKLEGRAAAAFVLRYYEGLDNRRIAETLGTSQFVVAVTLHRARARLRKEIGKYLEKHHEAR